MDGTGKISKESAAELVEEIREVSRQRNLPMEFFMKILLEAVADEKAGMTFHNAGCLMLDKISQYYADHPNN